MKGQKAGGVTTRCPSCQKRLVFDAETRVLACLSCKKQYGKAESYMGIELTADPERLADRPVTLPGPPKDPEDAS